jgi:hypothetical protein
MDALRPLEKVVIIHKSNLLSIGIGVSPERTAMSEKRDELKQLRELDAYLQDHSYEDRINALDYALTQARQEGREEAAKCVEKIEPPRWERGE